MFYTDSLQKTKCIQIIQLLLIFIIIIIINFNYN